jgi:multidrug efflux system membrane fusion protein
MYVKARLSMAVSDQAILVPQQAVSRNAKGEATVLVVDGEGKVQQRIVQTGQAVGSRWVIASGLHAGEQVVVEGTQKARNGDVVRAVELELDQAVSGGSARGDAESASVAPPASGAKAG